MRRLLVTGALLAAGAASAETPRTVRLGGLAVAVEGADRGEQARRFVGQRGVELGVDPASLRVAEVQERRVRFEQLHQGLPVLGRGVVVSFDDAGRVRSASADPVVRTVAPARIDAGRARELALRAAFGTPEGEPTPDAPVSVRRVVAALGDTGVEAFQVSVVRRPLTDHVNILVDASAGRVIGAESALKYYSASRAREPSGVVQPREAPVY